MIRTGQLLRQTRLKKNLSLEEIAQGTKIQQIFLEAIEEGEYAKLPSPSYAKGFVKNYAEYLGLSTRDVLPLFKRDFDEIRAYRVLPKGFVRENRYFLMGVRIRRAMLGGLILFIFFLSFLGFQYRGAFFSPSLRVEMPKDRAQITGDEVLVSGKTDPSVSLFINNAPIALAENGEFKKKLTFFPGQATIITKAVNKFGRETIIKRNVTLSP